MRHPPEVRARAHALFSAGMPLLRVAKVLGLPHVTVRGWLEPGRKAVIEQFRMSVDPKVRLEWSRRARYRAMARAEAAETGEDVEAVYERFGVATRRMSKPTSNGA